MSESMATTGEQIRLRDGRIMGYAECGDPAGEPVFIFHGTPGSRLIHPDQTQISSLGARLITLDRPGFGLSDFQPGRRLLDWPDDVAEVADRLGLGRFAVVGVSGGGPYVAACTYKIPQRLTTAALVSSAAPTDVPGAMNGMPFMRRAAVHIGRLAPWLLRPLVWLTSNPRRDLQGFFERYTAHNPTADQVLLARPEFREMLMASYAEATRAGIRGFAWEVQIMAQPWGFRLEDIPMEVHLWHGEEDNSTPLAMAQYLADTIPNCRARFLAGEGHLFVFTRWAEILTVLLEE